LAPLTAASSAWAKPGNMNKGAVRTDSLVAVAFFISCLILLIFAVRERI
jgi:hypothetical protein